MPEGFDPGALVTGLITDVSGSLTTIAPVVLGLAGGLLALGFGIRFARKHIKV